jgi:hypothetical protein
MATYPPHALLLAGLYLRLRGVPIPEVALLALLAIIPPWSIVLGWRRSLGGAFLRGPGIVIAACLILAWQTRGEPWSLPAVLILVGVTAIYALYSGVWFLVASLFRRFDKK